MVRRVDHAALRRFSGLPHRLEIRGTTNGVTWVDDSIATTPERVVAELRAFDVPVVLLLGGRDKGLPMDGLRQNGVPTVPRRHLLR